MNVADTLGLRVRQRLRRVQSAVPLTGTDRATNRAYIFSLCMIYIYDMLLMYLERGNKGEVKEDGNLLSDKNNQS